MFKIVFVFTALLLIGSTEVRAEVIDWSRQILSNSSIHLKGLVGSYKEYQGPGKESFAPVFERLGFANKDLESTKTGVFKSSAIFKICTQILEAGFRRKEGLVFKTEAPLRLDAFTYDVLNAGLRSNHLAEGLRSSTELAVKRRLQIGNYQTKELLTYISLPEILRIRTTAVFEEFGYLSAAEMEENNMNLMKAVNDFLSHLKVQKKLTWPALWQAFTKKTFFTVNEWHWSSLGTLVIEFTIYSNKGDISSRVNKLYQVGTSGSVADSDFLSKRALLAKRVAPGASIPKEFPADLILRIVEAMAEVNRAEEF